MDVAIGLILLTIAASLMYFGLPDRQGNSPQFLQFNVALVLYPPAILVFLALGVAELLFHV